MQSGLQVPAPPGVRPPRAGVGAAHSGLLPAGFGDSLDSESRTVSGVGIDTLCVRVYMIIISGILCWSARGLVGPRQLGLIHRLSTCSIIFSQYACNNTRNVHDVRDTITNSRRNLRLITVRVMALTFCLSFKCHNGFLSKIYLQNLQYSDQLAGSGLGASMTAV